MGYSALPVAAAGGFELNTDPIVITCLDGDTFGFSGSFALYDGNMLRSWRIANAGGEGSSSSVLDTGGAMPSGSDMADRLKIALDAASMNITVTVDSADVTITPDASYGVIFYSANPGFDY